MEIQVGLIGQRMRVMELLQEDNFMIFVDYTGSSLLTKQQYVVQLGQQVEQGQILG